ncbi:ABC transporter permease [Pseudomonas costantinii]|uniref:ABC transporter permease n=1 Tax=Pseudomonas costantinii TaxID=168469 RepID=UPI0015A0FE2D|nr:FtsX-like permease family protein [Pseudomonas costantinii]NVZ18751.1 ABC transporter permease [Pseudomonas costantinii]
MRILFVTRLILLNVLRDWRKNMIACVAIIVGTISLVLFGGYVAQIYEGIRLGSIYSQLGHYQVFSSRQGEEAYASSLIDSDQAVSAIRALEAQDEVRLVSRRIEAQGLLSFGNKSVGILAYGVEPDADAEISRAVRVVRGTGLFASKPEGALVGRELLAELGADIGDIVTFLTTTSEGAINAVDVQVVGAMDTGAKELNKRFMKINLPLMQEALYSKSITNLVVLLDETRLTAATDQRIRDAVANAGDKLTVKSWSEMSEHYHQIKAMFDNIFGFVTVLVIIIIFAAILNTMTMAVMERVSELSTIRALGVSRSQLLIMVLSEGGMVGLIAVVMGVLGGVLLSELINHARISMPTPPGSTFSYPLRILLDQKTLLLPAVLSLVATFVGGLIPAYRAGKLPINEAMQR